MGAGVVGRYVALWWLFVVVVDVDVPKTELQMSAIAAMIAVGSHTIAYKAEHHVSAIAAIIAVGSHTIAQSEIRTSFSKENSERVVNKDVAQ